MPQSPAPLRARIGARAARGRTRLLSRTRGAGLVGAALITVLAAITATLLAVGPASAQPVASAVVPHSTQRGPNPTLTMIEATRGPFATAQRSVTPGIVLAPFSPSQNLSTDKVPTLVLGGQKDPTVTPSYLKGLYALMPASTHSLFAQIAGANHLFYTHANNVQMKLIIPWLKIFVDGDTRYEQFLCPSLPDPSKISIYQAKCPYA